MMISISIGTVGIRVSGITVVGISMSITISMAISISAVSVISISSGLGISGPLAAISMVGISKGMSITIVSISSGLSSSSWLGNSRPLAIISVTISMAIISTKTMAITISMVSIIGTSISTGFSLTGSSGEETEGNNSNGFYHFECLQARGFS